MRKVGRGAYVLDQVGLLLRRPEGWPYAKYGRRQSPSADMRGARYRVAV